MPFPGSSSRFPNQAFPGDSPVLASAGPSPTAFPGPREVWRGTVGRAPEPSLQRWMCILLSLVLGPPGSPPRSGVPRPAGCGHHGADDEGRFEKLPALPPPRSRGGFPHQHPVRLRLQARRPWLNPRGDSLEQSERLLKAGQDFKAVPSDGEGWKPDLPGHTSFWSLASISRDFPTATNQTLLCSGCSPRPSRPGTISVPCSGHLGRLFF